MRTPVHPLAFAKAAAAAACILATPAGVLAQTVNGPAPSANPHLTDPVIPPLIIIAPTEVRTDPTLARGCWVRLFAEPDFQGRDDLTVAGPISVPSLHTPEGVDWHARTESILVGPKATLTVYENKDYRDKTMTFKPGEQVPRLREILKFTQSIDSLKIACGK
ncbi:hypothetical protein [Noviherbaspirillum galbum]|uniref:Calcium-dependent cell adhesion molecule N-terminal domain-containing protein n=1 Tax=Noviherbaspirillum galbum TaxID=2709383 RepID=A0A6B3SRF2_9BURK|nr:hypothetical protein [Noviherbaspirillum galbum]NEX61002.1 hypothetical protein [Noviherbaspirillum galbum]